MDKQQIIISCRVLCAMGLYCMPVFQYGEWMIRVNHAFDDWNYELFTHTLNLHFMDCMYNSHDMSQDYAIYHV